MGIHWTRPWVRTIAMALTLVAFALPVISVGACGCVGPACGQQPNPEAIEEARTPSDHPRLDAEVRATQSGWDAVAGRVSIAATSRDQRLGTGATFTQTARTFFEARTRPMYSALLVPLLGLIGAGLIFLPGRSGTGARIGVGILGDAATALVVDAAGARLVAPMVEFGRERTINWSGELRPNLEIGGVALYVLFLLPLACEVLMLLVSWARAAWGRRQSPS